MSRWRKIDVRMWADEKFRRLSSPGPNAQSLWFFLLTSPNTSNIPGLFRAGKAGLAEELNWNSKGFAEAFGELFAEGMVKADWDSRVVWVPKAIYYDPPSNPNVVKSWRGPWKELPECDLKSEAHQLLKGFLKGLGESFAKEMPILSGNGIRIPKPYPKPDPDPKNNTPATVVTGNEIEVVSPDHKAPAESAQAFNWLSYNFYLTRKKLGDDYFNPYDPKHLKICKGIVEAKALGNYEEARRRAINLVLHNRVQPNYYKITPQDLSGKWTDLNEPPVLAPGMRGLRDEVFKSQMDQIKERLRNGSTA